MYISHIDLIIIINIIWVVFLLHPEKSHFIVMQLELF